MRFDKENFEPKLRDFPIWKLINFCNVLTNRIIQLKKQGNKSDKKKIKRLSYKRGLAYRILLEKLVKWSEDGSDNEIDLTELNNKDMELFELTE